MESLDVLGHPGLRETFLYVRAQPGPVTAESVSGGLDVPRTVARWRLEKLAQAALLVTSFAPRTTGGPGVGRPSKLYAVAPETTPIELVPRHYDELLELLVAELPKRGRAAQLASVGVDFGLRLARAARLRPAATPRVGIARACRALGRLGFQASVESVSGGEAVIVTPTCPLRPLVLREPEARRIDEGMWRALVVAAVDGVTAADVSCGTHDCLHTDRPCRIVVKLS
ncbi:MAG: helix-turn-helix domain-containing protein [Gaiellaceae bacterium]